METLIQPSSYSMAMHLHNASPWECATVRSVMMTLLTIQLTLWKNIHLPITPLVVNQSVSVRTEDLWNVWQKHGYLKKQRQSIVSYIIFNLIQPLLVKKRGGKEPHSL